MTHDKTLVLVDTNILVYAMSDDPAKSQAAAHHVLELGRSGRGVLSVQTLSETYWVMTRKRRPAIPSEQAREILRDYASSWRIIEPGKTAFLKALDGVIDHRLSFWDAMQWAVAREHGVTTFLTEDLNHGQIIEGVKIANPFHGDAAVL